jgi:hypothetical protein
MAWVGNQVNNQFNLLAVSYIPVLPFVIFHITCPAQLVPGGEMTAWVLELRQDMIVRFR